MSAIQIAFEQQFAEAARAGEALDCQEQHWHGTEPEQEPSPSPPTMPENDAGLIWSPAKERFAAKVVALNDLTDALGSLALEPSIGELGDEKASDQAELAEVRSFTNSSGQQLAEVGASLEVSTGKQFALLAMALHTSELLLALDPSLAQPSLAEKASDLDADAFLERGSPVVSSQNFSWAMPPQTSATESSCDERCSSVASEFSFAGPPQAPAVQETNEPRQTEDKADHEMQTNCLGLQYLSELLQNKVQERRGLALDRSWACVDSRARQAWPSRRVGGASASSGGISRRKIQHLHDQVEALRRLEHRQL